jgi:DNA-binding transcriptional LysR family regulator
VRSDSTKIRAEQNWLCPFGQSAYLSYCWDTDSMPRLLNTHGLIAFLTVAEQGSINAAAELLHVSQPALTRTIRELEDQLGARLFDRNAKGVSLTAFGHGIVGHARRLRAELELIERNAQSHRAGRRRHMSIGAVPIHPIALIAKALATLHEHENVAINIVIGSQAEMIDLLKAAKIEMVLGPLVTHKDSTGLIQETINQEETEFYCRSGNPLAQKAHPGPEDLGAAKWILGGRDTTLRARIDEHFAGFNVILDVPLEIEDVALRRSIVTQSDFVSAFQTHHVFNEVRTGTLARIPYPQTHERQPVGCIRISDHTDLSRRLIDLLRQNYESAALK